MVLTPVELAAIDTFQSNASLNAVDREYAIGNVLSRAYGSSSAELRTHWPIFAEANGLPSAVTAAMNGLCFGKSLSLLERAFKEVEPYLPGGPIARHWEHECPCQEYALQRIKAELEVQRRNEEENEDEADANATARAAATSITSSITQSTYVTVISSTGTYPATVTRRHDTRPEPISPNPQGIHGGNGKAIVEEIKFRVNATLIGLVGVYVSNVRG